MAADDDSGGYLTSLVTFNVTEGTDYQIDVDGYQGASGRVVLGLAAGNGLPDTQSVVGRQRAGDRAGAGQQGGGAGGQRDFQRAASSPTKITYQWYFQGERRLPGPPEAPLIISHVQPGSVGLYDVRVANAAGSAQSEPASLQIGVNQGGTVTSPGTNLSIRPVRPRPSEAGRVNCGPLPLGGDTRGFSVAQTFSTAGATRSRENRSPCGQVGGALAMVCLYGPGFRQDAGQHGGQHVQHSAG